MGVVIHERVRGCIGLLIQGSLPLGPVYLYGRPATGDGADHQGGLDGGRCGGRIDGWVFA